MTKIVCISDTHACHEKVEIPECDILICAGDVSRRGEHYQIEDFLDWFSHRPASSLVFVAGNHDFSMEEDLEWKAQLPLLYPKVHYLESSGITLDGLKIWGDPHTPTFHNWAFNLNRGPSIDQMWQLIPSDADIVVTHGPCYGILDKTRGGDDAGCVDLARHIQERVKPKLFVSGHIHESYGQLVKGDTTYVNASTCDIAYRPVNKPIVVDL